MNLYKVKIAKVDFQKNGIIVPKMNRSAHLKSRGLHESDIFRGDGDKKLYSSLVSQPTMLSIITQNDQEKMCKLLGSANIMHDKRVFRGSNFTKQPNQAKESQAAREAEVRRRAMARKKELDNQTRALRLHLKTPKYAARGRPYMEYQSGNTNLIEWFDVAHQATQTAEFDQELLLYPGTGTSSGIDASTQVDEKDLFDFDTEVIPIAEALITDIFKWCILEILYEDELDARARRHRSLYLRRTIEEIERQKLEHKDKWLNHVVAYHSQLFDDRSQRSELTTGRVVNLLPKVLSENRITTNTIEYPEIVSWIMKELQTNKAVKQIVISDTILKSIIYDLVRRHPNTCNKFNELNTQKPKELFEEYYSISSQYDPYIDAYNGAEDG